MRSRTIQSSQKSDTKTQLKKQELEQTVLRFSTEYQEKEAAYRLQNGETAKSVLELCKVVYDASSSLGKSKSYLKDFREKNGLGDKSTYSQFKTIGLNFARLNPHASVLPSSWYTLYKIAKLDDAQFAHAIESGKLRPFVTQREVRELSGKKTAPQRQDYHIKIDIVADSSFDVAHAVHFHSALVAFLRDQQKQWSCVDHDVTLSSALTDALAAVSEQKAA
jgi:hypothetical protein